MTGELSAIVSNDAIGVLEPMDDVVNELSRSLGLEVDDGPDFNPLSKLVNGD